MRLPWAHESDDKQTVTLRVTGNAEDPYTPMIEPYGMTYDLGASDRM